MASADTPARLTPVQLSALVILMAEAREVSNAELTELANFTLTGKDRAGLEEAGLIESRKIGRVMAFQLTDRGWAFCKQLHETPVNVGTSRAARAMFPLLGGVHRALDRLRVSHADFFKQSGESHTAPAPEPPAAVPGDVESQVRAAYAELVRRPGQWIGLADLREQLPGVEPEVFDGSLRELALRPGVRIIPVANSKALDERDRAAALRMGGEDHHALSIGPA